MRQFIKNMKNIRNINTLKSNISHQQLYEEIPYVCEKVIINNYKHDKIFNFRYIYKFLNPTILSSYTNYIKTNYNKTNFDYLINNKIINFNKYNNIITQKILLCSGLCLSVVFSYITINNYPLLLFPILSIIELVNIKKFLTKNKINTTNTILTNKENNQIIYPIILYNQHNILENSIFDDKEKNREDKQNNSDTIIDFDYISETDDFELIN